MRHINIFLSLLFSLSVALAQQPLKYEIHSRGMIRQSVFNNGTLGRPLDTGVGGSLQNMPSFEWPNNGGYPYYVGAETFHGFYNSMGAGFWLAGDTSQYSGTGPTPRVNVPCGGWLNAEGDAIRGDVVRAENYPILADGTINPSYNSNEAEEKIVSTWDTPLGISIKRTSRAWSHPDYDDFIIYEIEMTNTGIGAVTGRLDTIRALTIGLAYHLAPSMIGGMLKNNGVWSDLIFRGDKVGAGFFNYARYNWTRWMVYNHTINGLPYYTGTDTILTASGAIGILPLYYDYDHLANKYECKVALNNSSVTADTVTLYDSNKKLKQPYAIHFDNGNLNLDKFARAHNPEYFRNKTPMKNNSDSSTYGQYWIGRGKADWLNTLRNPTGKTYVFGPYTLAPGAIMKFVYAEVAGFGVGTAGDSIYSDMGGGWGWADMVPYEEPSPGVHQAPNWWNALAYPELSPPSTGYATMGSTYMQNNPLPDYVNSSVISIRDVADRAIQMWKGGPVVKYDDTSRYMNTFATRDMSKQFDPAPTPIGKSSSTGVFQVPIPCPAPAIQVATVIDSSTSTLDNKIMWGSQVETFTTPRLHASFGYYQVLRANDPVGPWTLIDSVGKRDPRYFHDSLYIFYDTTRPWYRTYFYSVVSVDTLGGKSGKTNITLHATDTATVGITEPDRELPLYYTLSQNYPNPFNPTTTIKYQLPTKTRVRLEVFNLLGQRVATLVDAEQQAGTYQTLFDASTISSGIYFYRITAGKFVKSQKMLLLR